MPTVDDSFILHPALKKLFHYWLELSGGERLPRRQDIDPTMLRSMLPHLYILDAGAHPDDLRYRLAGSSIVQGFGFEPRGMTRAEMRERYVKPERRGDFDQTSAETHAIVAKQVVAYSHDHMTSYTKDFLAYARLNLPISEDGVAPSGVIGAIYLSSDRQPFWQNFAHLHIEVPVAEILQPGR